MVDGDGDPPKRNPWQGTLPFVGVGAGVVALGVILAIVDNVSFVALVVIGCLIAFAAVSAGLVVVPEHVVHPGLLGGWWLSKTPVPRRTPDEAAR